MSSSPPDSDVLLRLARRVASRRNADPSASHTARLLADGVARCAQKLGEEAVETAIAAVLGERKAIVDESADLLYHLLVTLEAAGTPLDDVLRELERRMET